MDELDRLLEAPPPPPPESLAALLRQAIRDARSLDRSVYWPAYDTWHEPDFEYHHLVDIERGFWPVSDVPDSRCHVCLGGAIIAGTLGVGPRQYAAPNGGRMTPLWNRALSALDHIRRGRYIEAALTRYGVENVTESLREQLLGLPEPAKLDFRDWDDFNEHLDSLDGIADRLERIGA